MRTTEESSPSPSDQCNRRRSSLVQHHNSNNYGDHRRRRKNQNVLPGPIRIQHVFWNRSYFFIWLLLLFARWFWQCWTCLRIWVIASTTIVSFVPIPMMMMMMMMIPLDDIGYTSIASVHGLIFTEPRGSAGRLKYCTPNNNIINKNCNNDNHMKAYGGYSIRQQRQQQLPSRLSSTAIFSSHKNLYPPNFVTSDYRRTAQKQPSVLFSRCWMMMVVPRSSMLLLLSPPPPPSTIPLLRMTHHAQQHSDYSNSNDENDNKDEEEQLGREELYAQRLQRQIAWLRAKDRSSRPIPVQVQYPL
jgi:hypothetical protein